MAGKRRLPPAGGADAVHFRNDRVRRRRHRGQPALPAVSVESLLDAIVGVPGSAGDVLALVLQGGPWILFVISALVPTIAVRTARRARMHAIEQDLPLALELFATMAEAGLGFDAALARIVRAQGSDRALSSEFVNFQHDMLAGMSRTRRCVSSPAASTCRRSPALRRR